MKEKGRFLKKYRGNECLNCGVPLDIVDRYCNHCGQINTNKRLSLKDFFNEFFASIFSYDSRLRHTILALLFKPGKISKEYIEGKRVKYANPFRFYLSVSIIFFIINGLFIDFDGFRTEIEDQVTEGKKTFEEIKEAVPIDSITQEIRKTEDLSEEDLALINKKLLDIEGLSSLSAKKTESKKATYYSQEEINNMNIFEKGYKLFPMYEDYHDRTGEKSAHRALADLKHEKSRLNRYIYHRVLKTNEIEENYGQEFFEFIFNKLPFIIFFFLPFFALSIWLLYIRRSFNYMEHLIFTFHTQTMFFIIIGFSILISKIANLNAFFGVAMLAFLFYLYKAMRKFYNQGRAKTIVKFLLVNVLFFILATLGSVLTIVGSIFIF
ncbi:DUF3667 domain-containing protein [Aquimarina sp. AD10]|uniref:DUF3667 domain-containing protein n=1 Tax=Aquimarina sp. AD10 TaxID=1714849 RepID=UPI000E53037A|nr:DUF3667 domain-containing protein [Aquimarina sp. AD10]AXT60826.1 DUF3667 domain-containing protein [Aquimarina sp. AD10]RKM98475.1 DUF3667 domain-containing protein [Aquimarina sp. AD10]